MFTANATPPCANGANCRVTQKNAYLATVLRHKKSQLHSLIVRNIAKCWPTFEILGRRGSIKFAIKLSVKIPPPLRNVACEIFSMFFGVIVRSRNKWNVHSFLNFTQLT